MKKLLVVLALLSTPVLAEEEKPTTPTDMCIGLERLSSAVMEARQKGVPLVKALSIVSDQLGKEITIAAYKKAKYSTKSMQQRQVTEFANSVLLECLEKIK